MKNNFTSRVYEQKVLKVITNTANIIDANCIINKSTIDNGELVSIDFSSQQKLERFIDSIRQQKIQSDFN